MKRPWESSSRPVEDMEALQTDVMRFMAILGLCLAAIFSILKNPDPPAQQQPPSFEGDAEQIASPAVAESVVRKSVEQAVAQPLTLPEAVAEPKQDAEEGFTLEFSSAAGLERLLLDGRASLFAHDGELYWRWIGPGTFQRSDAPGSYYGMHQGTVPAQLRIGLPVVRPGESLQWGVVLDTATSGQIGALMQQRKGGSLLIASDGSVDFVEHN